MYDKGDKTMNLIVAVSKNYGIGKNGGLLFSLPTDMKFFRETTQNSAVITGRKTLESFPGGKPLKNRVNIVLTRDENFSAEGAVVCRTKDEALKKASEYDKVFVIGGEEIYKLFLPECDTAYVTKVESCADADKFFPNLDTSPEWRLAKASEPITENGHTFAFCTYKKIKE